MTKNEIVEAAIDAEMSLNSILNNRKDFKEIEHHINLRISRLNHSLEILTYNEPDIDVYHWAEGRKEQIKDELDFLETFQILNDTNSSSIL